VRPAVYVPIDISQDALDAATRRLGREFRGLRIHPLLGDFSRPIDIPVRRGMPSVVYFPGSTIGNLTPEEAHAFLSMSRGIAARMLVGVDLKKDPALLHAAYNDAAGVTAAFNLNLLARINRELGADFDLRRWRHYAFYNPAEGRIEMHLVSMGAQNVALGKHRFHFASGETIHTENSCKYSLDGFRELAAKAGFTSAKVWTDRRGLFTLHGLT
jgi:dimethylhistidine N-methyltransferase